MLRCYQGFHIKAFEKALFLSAKPESSSSRLSRCRDKSIHERIMNNNKLWYLFYRLLWLLSINSAECSQIQVRFLNDVNSFFNRLAESRCFILIKPTIWIYNSFKFSHSCCYLYDLLPDPHFSQRSFRSALCSSKHINDQTQEGNINLYNITIRNSQ